MKSQINLNAMSTKPWRDKDGKLLGDGAIKQISKSWDTETWEEYLVATVDVERAPEELIFTEFERLLEETSQGLWAGPLYIPKLVRLRLNQAIRSLTKKQMEVIWLIYWHELSQREIAKKLKISVQTVNGNKFISLNKIKYFLENDPDTASYLIGGSKSFGPKPLSQYEQILEIYFQDLKGSYIK